MSTDSHSPPSTAGDIIDLFRKHDLLGELDLASTHAGTMKTRGRIPASWHVAMVTVAAKHGLPVTYELLARIAANEVAAS